MQNQNLFSSLQKILTIMTGLNIELDSETKLAIRRITVALEKIAKCNEATADFAKKAVLNIEIAKENLRLKQEILSLKSQIETLNTSLIISEK